MCENVIHEVDEDQSLTIETKNQNEKTDKKATDAAGV